ncbi:MAG: amino acid dehydrogenase [Gemmatimonadales bacterium]|nr:amino acid dehydrogenase [Gemmatimonadales bacterium]MXX77791.1 amino acid dehydrogenase [Gemmatimonadales bacterium]MYC88041.1 amino acid dehydrogenase [Candidatus Palauibacter denitrificans]
MTRGFLDVTEAWNGESVVTAFDSATGAWIFVALHDTRLGPAAGGTRMASYPAPVDGLIDAMRLAEGMTWKWAGVGVRFGGGKAVIAVPDGLSDATRAGLVDRYAARLVSLRGAFQTGVDMGTTPEDMARIGAISGYAVGLVDGKPGDPGPYTARGVLAGIRATLEHRFGEADFGARAVLVQGLGDVGFPLAGLLAEAGATLYLTDLREEAARRAQTRFGGTVVPADGIWDVDADVYAPCAVGATLNPDTIPRLRCGVVAGSANNQLLSDADAERLCARGILYAPDYVINAGGAVAFAAIHRGERDETRLRARVDAIGSSLQEIFEEAADARESPLHAARRRARRFLDAHGGTPPGAV